MKRVAASPMRLQQSVINGFGLAGFCSAIPLLRRHACIERLRTRAQALAEGDAMGAKGELGGHEFLERQWDGPSERGLAALVALARLGADVDIAQVCELYTQSTNVLPPELGGHGFHARARMAAVLFHADAIGLEEARAASADTGDLLTTLLRRGDESTAAALVESPRFRIMGHAFHFWPALDYAMPPDYAQRGLVGSIGVDSMYPLSRDAGVSPPTWWRWRTSWTRSDSARVMRGELTG